MPLTTAQSAAYLARIALPAPPTPDAAGLLRVQHAHRLAIPFENLDVRLGRPVSIDSDAVFAKLVDARRGGFCFEHNRLFLDALASFGFEARPLLARVWLGASETPPLTHTLALVTIDGAAWIADAGFGGSYAPPMPLADGAVTEAPDGARFRLEREGDDAWLLWRQGPAATTDGRRDQRDDEGGWQRQYGFTLAPVADADLQMGAHWSATAPASRFVRHVVISLVLPRGFAALTDRAYRRHAGGQDSATTIDDPRVYRLRLSLLFGIDLPAEEVASLGLF